MEEEKNEEVETSQNNEENTDSQNGENQVEENPDLDVLKKENQRLSEANKKLFARTKKAEGFVSKDGEWVKPEPKEEKPEEQVDNSQPNEPEYSKLAFLEGRNVKHPDDQKAVLDEAERLKLPLTDVLEMKHIKQQLKDAKTERDVQDNTPKGKGGRSGKSQQEVDYWVQKGELPKDPELAEKVVNAKIANDPSKKWFEDLE